jgi:hypothetical protein
LQDKPGDKMQKIIFSVILLSSFLFAQEMSESFNTGDKLIDQHLQDVNAYGKTDYQFFKTNLSLKFGISIQDVDRYVYQDKIQPGDLYYACAIASTMHRNIDDVIVLYKDKKGWGEVANDLGIKPGSREFFRLKGKSISGIGKVKSKIYDKGRDKMRGRK